MEHSEFSMKIKEASALYNQRKFDDALCLVEKLLQYHIPEKKINLLYFKGDILFDKNCFWESEQIFDEILNSQASDIAYNNRGWARWEQKKYDEALADFRAAIMQNPLHYIAFYAAGEILLKIGKPAEAKAYCMASLAIQPTYYNALELKKDIIKKLNQIHIQTNEDVTSKISPNAHNERKLLFEAIKRKRNEGLIREALSEIDVAIAQSSLAIDTITELLFIKYDIFLDCNQYESAKAVCNRLLSIDSKNMPALLNGGYAKFKLMEYQSALIDFQSCILIDPMQSNAYYGVGRVYSKTFDYNKAETFCKMALTIEPENDEYKRFLTFLEQKVEQPEVKQIKQNHDNPEA